MREGGGPRRIETLRSHLAPGACGSTSPPPAHPPPPCRVRLDHAHLFCSDVGRSVAFYRVMFGARIVWDAVLAGARSVRLELGDYSRRREFMALQLYEQPPRGPDSRPDVHHVGVRCFNLPALVEHVRRCGLRGSEGGSSPQWGLAGLARGGALVAGPTFRYVMASDPDGLLLELYEDRPSREHPWPEDEPEAQASTRSDPMFVQSNPDPALAGLYFSHAHIFSDDVTETVEFFAQALGGRVAFELADAAGARNVWVTVGGGGLNLCTAGTFCEPLTLRHRSSRLPDTLPADDGGQQGKGRRVHEREDRARGGDGVVGRPLLHHLGVRTDNLPALLHHLRDAGVQFRHGAKGHGAGWRYAMCETPDGLLLELFENARGFDPAEAGAP